MRYLQNENIKKGGMASYSTKTETNTFDAYDLIPRLNLENENYKPDADEGFLVGYQ